ncbi:uncharacterized protein B0I36DRAFT_352727 [Microdochium trichocladiopsis]|uniref:Uncharacterized protein n=1 Tax=Microdochium trichocladiopsis TaxID=1682393 RepID=A0A9P8XX82_9PEZI|nr:uncharacterized protein B0I36DRAFT_352727 [Microdochium trichocladiopsis]KAH7024496.1 hypothetical protein B0I36DRAFT_352727 [Microdochium trichocladiopsis]
MVKACLSEVNFGIARPLGCHNITPSLQSLSPHELLVSTMRPEACGLQPGGSQVPQRSQDALRALYHDVHAHGRTLRLGLHAKPLSEQGLPPNAKRDQSRRAIGLALLEEPYKAKLITIVGRGVISTLLRRAGARFRDLAWGFNLSRPFCIASSYGSGAAAVAVCASHAVSNYCELRTAIKRKTDLVQVEASMSMPIVTASGV